MSEERTWSGSKRSSDGSTTPVSDFRSLVNYLSFEALVTSEMDSTDDLGSMSIYMVVHLLSPLPHTHIYILGVVNNGQLCVG